MVNLIELFWSLRCARRSFTTVFFTIANTSTKRYQVDGRVWNVAKACSSNLDMKTQATGGNTGDPIARPSVSS